MERETEMERRGAYEGTFTHTKGYLKAVTQLSTSPRGMSRSRASASSPLPDACVLCACACAYACVHVCGAVYVCAFEKGEKRGRDSERERGIRRGGEHNWVRESEREGSTETEGGCWKRAQVGKAGAGEGGGWREGWKEGKGKAGVETSGRERKGWKQRVGVEEGKREEERRRKEDSESVRWHAGASNT